MTVYVVDVSPVFDAVMLTVLVPLTHVAAVPLVWAVPFTVMATVAPSAPVADTVSVAFEADAV